MNDAPETTSVRISGMAADLLCLPDEPTYGTEHGDVVATTKTGKSYLLTGHPEALIHVAEMLHHASGDCFDRPANEKACTRRAARKIYAELGRDLPFDLQPRKRRSPRSRRRRR